MVSKKAIEFLEKEIKMYHGMALASKEFKKEFTRNEELLQEVLREVTK